MGTRVTIRNARLSYPHLAQARAVNPGDDPKFGAALLIPKNDPVIQELLQAQQTEMGLKWGSNIPPTAKGMPLYDGDTEPKYAADSHNHGYMILNTSAMEQPGFADPLGNEIMSAACFYAGCYVNVNVGVFPYDKPMSKGIAVGLNGVQFVQDGDRLDNRPSVSDMFGAVEGAPAAIAPGLAAGATPQQFAAPAPGAPPVGTPAAPAPMAPAPAAAPAAPSAPQVPPSPDFLG